MNGIFLIIFLLSAIYFLIFNPAALLPALLAGGSKAATLCLSLVAIYAVWLGLMGVMQECGLTKLTAKILRPAVRTLFKTDDEPALFAIAGNLSANMLGVGGVATPFGIEACQLLEKGKNVRYNHAMLFTLNATSVQILPTTVLALLISFGATAPYSILLPSLLATLTSTVVGVVLVKVFIKPNATPEKNGVMDKRGHPCP